MENKYDITITNGSGSSNVLNGNYSVIANATGYNNSSISPNSIQVVEGTNEYNFTIAAEGNLVIHVTENGTQSGTPIVGATFIRCDSTGNEYGETVTTNAEGNATLQNLPFSSTNAPKVYLKQKSTDQYHTFDSNVKEQTLESSSKTIEVTNPLPVLRTFNLTDANYTGLAIESGTISLN